MTAEKAVKILKANEERRIASIYASIKDLAIKALEKQIPQKPILKETKCFDGSADDFVFVCPVCNRTICREPEDDVIAYYIKEEYPHCNCGQALDWSDTE